MTLLEGGPLPVAQLEELRLGIGVSGLDMWGLLLCAATWMLRMLGKCAKLALQLFFTCSKDVG